MTPKENRKYSSLIEYVSMFASFEHTFGLMNLDSLRVSFASLSNYVQLVHMVEFYTRIEIHNTNLTLKCQLLKKQVIFN